MIRINLLPVRAAQKKERLRSQGMILVLSVVGVVAACALVWMSLSGKVDKVKSEVRAKNAEIARLQKTIGDVKDIEAKKAELKAKLDVLAKLKANRSGPGRLLDELSRVIPEKVWIKSFSEAAGAISISGTGLTEESVADFIAALEKSKFYMNVELDVMEQKEIAGRSLQSFSIRCTVEKQQPVGSQGQKAS